MSEKDSQDAAYWQDQADEWKGHARKWEARAKTARHDARKWKRRYEQLLDVLDQRGRS